MFLLKKLIRLLQGQMMIKKMQSIDSMETYAYGTNKVLINEKEEFKCNNIIKRHKKENIK